LQSLSNIIKVIKSGRVRWVGHVACMETWGMCGSFSQKTRREEITGESEV